MKKVILISTERGFLLAVMLIVTLSISSQSIWIDEGYTASHVKIQSWGAFIDSLIGTGASQAQMPLYLIVGWISEKVFGYSEWAMRLPNLFWAFCGIFSLWWIGRKIQFTWLVMIFAVQPYLWFYMDEARPYAMQIGAASLALMALYGLLHSDQNRLSYVFLLSMSLFCICGASMLGAITAGWVYLALILYFYKGEFRLCKKDCLVMAGGVCILLGLGLYFAWTLYRGAGGAVMWSSVGLKNLALTAYEFAGATGLGPPRYELREWGQSGQYKQILSSVWLGCMSVGLPLSFLVVHYFYERFAGQRKWWSFSMCCLVIAVGSVLTLLILAVIAGWPFWGRHLAPAFPFYIFWLGVSIRELLQRSKRLGYVVVALLLAIHMAASLQIRFSDRHLKDDYRNAAAVAIEAIDKGKVVWWVADPSCGEYYKVPDRTDTTKGAHYMMWVEEEALRQTASPDLIIMTKPSLMDPNKVVRSYIRAEHFDAEQTFPAFVVYKRAHVRP